MIKLDGIPISNWGLRIQKEHDHPAIPDLKRKTITIPGMPGEWDLGTDIGPRPFRFPLGFIEYDSFEKQRRLNDFVAFLFDTKGKPREIKLTFDYEPDKFYLVKVPNTFYPQRKFEFAFFDIEFVASYPYKRFIVSTDEIQMDSDAWVQSEITLEAIYTYNITNAKVINIINDGTIEIRPTIIIDGTADSLTFSINGESFSFAQITGPIEIQADKYLVKVNGVSKLSAMTGAIEKLVLKPSDNEVTVTGSNLNINITFRFYHQYV